VRVGLLHASSRSGAGWWRGRICVVAAEAALKFGKVEVALQETGDGVEDGRTEEAKDGVAEAESDPGCDEREAEYGGKILSSNH
jgi:hypothetical protein